MRYKVVPEPRSLEFLAAAREALPLVPSPEADCCARIMAETDVDDREVASEYVTFLTALDLLEETDRGYHRTPEDPDLDPTTLGARFREHVYAANEVLAALDAADGARDPAEVFETVRDAVPRWERDRDPDWETTWQRRVERLLEWAVRFDLAERAPDGYRTAGSV